MPSFSSQLVNTLGRRVIKRHDLEPQTLVKHLRRAFNHAPALTLLPEGVRVDALRHASFNGDRVGVKDPRLTILYLHGGAFVAGVTRTRPPDPGALNRRQGRRQGWRRFSEMRKASWDSRPRCGMVRSAQALSVL